MDFCQKWCVIAWPSGTLSHQAWETPWSPVLSPSCWSETISFSWSERLSADSCWPVMGRAVTVPLYDRTFSARRLALGRQGQTSGGDLMGGVWGMGQGWLAGCSPP